MKNITHGSPRRFAAKRKHKWFGWFAVATGVVNLFSNTGEDPLLWTFVCFVFIGIGVFLLRGPDLSTKAQNKSREFKSKIDEAAQELANSSGGKTVVAYRNLEELLMPSIKLERIKSRLAVQPNSSKSPTNRPEKSGNLARLVFPEVSFVKGLLKSSSRINKNGNLEGLPQLSNSTTYSQQFEDILTEIGFDKSRIQSDHIGSFSGIEVYKDWIISDQLAFDVDATTRGEVNVDQHVQIDAKGERWPGAATAVFASTTWSHSFPLSLGQISEARRVISQLNAISDAMKPKSVTSADIAVMIETILNNSGQSPAEKLKQLSDLRFQRLLTDSEFEAAKSKVLGI